MFERLQKPFLTVETGEAYQPIRLTYELHHKDKLAPLLNQLKCCEKNGQGQNWSWSWRDECADLHFESLDGYKKNPTHPVRLATLTIHDDKFYINLNSFKRACLAVPFFQRLIPKAIAKIHHADFINKVFGLDERLPHGFTELFKEEELERVIQNRIHEYEKVHEQCENAKTIEEAFTILSEYTQTESKKRLPYSERYLFQESEISQDPDVLFLGFYIFLRGRELVAIRRWFGGVDYNLSNAADETMNQVFGGMSDIDLIE
jgi:hypothetical protein